MAKPSDIVVVAGHGEGRIYPETYDLIAFARKLQELRDGALRILIFGAKIDSIAEALAKDTGQAVEAVICPDLSQYCSEGYRTLLAAELRNQRPAFLLAIHNSQGLDFAPAVAAELKAACITGVTGLALREEEPVFQKYAYGGKVQEQIRPAADACVLTVQPGVFQFRPDPSAPPGEVVRKTAERCRSHSRTLGKKRAAADTSAITEAKVIVAAGNGIGEEENMELIHELARLFQKSAVAGTRTVCDKGWLSYNQQVGITGATVSPELYIACGISGAVQHVMGMQGARMVVAINKDERAAIFNEADICIVEDLNQFIPLLLEACGSE
jgi:electron transfer flavoprotein alpha subunit